MRGRMRAWRMRLGASLFGAAIALPARADGAHPEAALSWALVTSLSTVRRTAPQISGAQLASASTCKLFCATPPRLPPEKPPLLDEPRLLDPPVPPPLPLRVAEPVRSKVGKKPARASATSACDRR